jgi:hypothetical protein
MSYVHFFFCPFCGTKNVVPEDVCSSPQVICGACRSSGSFTTLSIRVAAAPKQPPGEWVCGAIIRNIARIRFWLYAIAFAAWIITMATIAAGTVALNRVGVAHSSQVAK